MQRRLKLFESTIIAGLAVAAISAAPGALAQDGATAPTTTDTVKPPATPPKATDSDTIVITGSRLKTTEFTAPGLPT